VSSRIIADYLIAAGEDVLHIRGANSIEPARMTRAARPQPDRTLVYLSSRPASFDSPARVIMQWTILQRSAKKN